MQIIIKVILSFVALLITVFLFGVIPKNASGDIGFLKFILFPALIIALIGIWKYKPKQKSHE